MHVLFFLMFGLILPDPASCTCSGDDWVRGDGAIWNDPNGPGDPADASYTTSGSLLTIIRDTETSTWQAGSEDGTYYPQGVPEEVALVYYRFECILWNLDGCIRWQWFKFQRNDLLLPWALVGAGIAGKGI